MNSVVSAINSSLMPLNAVVYGISTPTSVEDSEGSMSIIPTIINTYGECTYIDPEDTNPLTIYHRLYGNQYPEMNKGFGDGNGAIIVYDMALICFGVRAKVRTTPDAVERQIVSLIPRAVSGSKISIISADFDQQRIFAAEFPNVKSFLNPSMFLFALKYKVKFSYNSTNCLKINT